MTDEELIARLHKQTSAGRVNHVSKTDRLAAADRIKSKAAEIERLRGDVEKMIGGADTVLEAWDHHMRDVVVPGTLHDAIEELRADVAEVNGGNDAKGNM